uniref:PLAT domain-containing protein n=1 Tax=Macrostomum lignano TaxID=282301 RepID=A0A1I8J2K7_9PLAT
MSPATRSPHPVVTYRVSISSQRAPSASARPFIQLCGSAGHSGARRLHRRRPVEDAADSAAAATATVDATASFALSCVSLGELNKIRVGLESPADSDAWIFDLVTVEEEGTAKQWSFCNSLELYPTQASVTLEPLGPAGSVEGLRPVDWLVELQVSLESGQHQTGQLFLALYGERGHTRDVCLNPDGGQVLRCGERQSFNLRLSNVGKLTKVRLSAQADHHWDNCLLSSLSLTDQSDDSSSTPLVSAALNCRFGREPDALLCKEIPLLPGDSTRLYFVYIRPGQEFGTATDANFFVDVHGERGNTGRRALLLESSPADSGGGGGRWFTHGATRVFRVEAADLGQIE